MLPVRDLERGSRATRHHQKQQEQGPASQKVHYASITAADLAVGCRAVFVVDHSHPYGPHPSQTHNEPAHPPPSSTLTFAIDTWHRTCAHLRTCINTGPDWGQHRSSQPAAHSHSIVPGGLLVTSSTTRLTSLTSLVIRVEIRASTSYGTRVQSAVIASSDDTGRKTIG